MKRWLLILFIIPIAAVSAVFIFLPTSQNFAITANVSCAQSAATRIIINNKDWSKWCAAKKVNDSTYIYNDCWYKLNRTLLNGFEITIYNKKDSVKGFLAINSDENNTAAFTFSGTFRASVNPVKRIAQYFYLIGIKKDISNFLYDLKKYFDKQENIYGFKIIMEKVKDQSLISAKKNLDHYPDTKEIYEMIASLKNYIKNKNGEEVNYPMLNIYTEDSVSYQVMVAIPTKQDLPSEGKFRLKKMVLGNILTAQVKGGVQTVMNGENSMKNYVTDYSKVSPAIPYQLLVTDRHAESDSSKWITRLYYPIFH